MAAPNRPGWLWRGRVYPGRLMGISIAGGNFLADRSLLADPATAALRGSNRLPSVPTLWRFLTGADLGRVAQARAVDRTMCCSGPQPVGALAER